MAEQVKTNVMRILDAAGVPYRVHTYDPEAGIDGLSVARQLGQDPQQTFKTLVTQGKSRAFYVFVIPVAESLNLKEAARACREKSVEMIPQRALLPNTGYVHGGCSPIGMKKLYPTFIDETAQLFAGPDRQAADPSEPVDTHVDAHNVPPKSYIFEYWKTQSC